jgi:O-antigen ligase
MLLYTAVAVAVLVAVCVPLLPTTSGVIGALGGKMVATPFGEVNLNTIGYVVGPLAAVALGMSVGSRRSRARFWLGAAAFICVLGLVLTKSRGAWLGFGVAFLYVILRKRSLALLITGAAAALAVILSDVLRALLVSRAAATTVYDPSLLGRFVLWNFAWRIGKANWLLGVGMENFRYVKHFYGFPEPLSAAIQFNAHNIYLEVFADLGVVGLAAFMWLLVSSFTRSSNAMRSDVASDLGLGLSAGLVAYAAHGLFDCVLFQPGVFALLGLFVGLSAGLNRLTAVPASSSSTDAA